MYIDEETETNAQAKHTMQSFHRQPHPSSRLSPFFLRESHALLDLRNGQRRVQALGARPRAVENGVASVQAHAVVQRILALGPLLISRVGDPAVALQQHSGAEVFFLVPPVRGARRRAAGAEDALVEAIELLAVFLGLAELTALA
jgi:hypothetical protein